MDDVAVPLQQEGSCRMSVAVSGADGFVGQALCEYLEARGVDVVRLVRKSEGCGTTRRVTGDLATSSNLEDHLRGVDVVVHLASRAHILRDDHPQPDVAFEQTNVVGTIRLARAAQAVGVRRFVFVSSIGVNGERTNDHAFTELDPPRPAEPYARSKLKAEEQLKTLAAGTSLELVIVRPPLVYGPRAPGNFQRLLRLASSGVPLPLGGVRNKRSIIGLENLCSVLATCMVHPAAAGETFLVADPSPYSTPQLLTLLSAAMGARARLFVVPLSLLSAASSLIGKRREFEKLCGSLEVCAAKAERLLDWRPNANFQEEIARTVAALPRES